jgi:hypothetical protein
MRYRCAVLAAGFPAAAQAQALRLDDKTAFLLLGLPALLMAAAAVYLLARGELSSLLWGILIWLSYMGAMFLVAWMGGVQGLVLLALGPWLGAIGLACTCAGIASRRRRERQPPPG